jgi:hypothetical protein
VTQYLKFDSYLPWYMAYPRFLLEVNMSETAKLVYMLLLDRARVSMKNDTWQDEHGRVFVLYTIPDLARDISKGETTVKKALNQLVQQDLIQKQSLGAGHPNKIYVKIPAEISPTGQTEKCLTGRAFFDPKAGRKVPPNNNKRNKYIRNYDCKEGESL